MNPPSTMNELFTKLNDLNSVFKYGERVIPIIQSLVDFMRDTVPLLEKINRSLTESTSKIPKAKNQIVDVASATEMATTEILDLVDLISSDVEKIENGLKQILEKQKEKNELQNEILQRVNDSGLKSLLIKYFELSDLNSKISPFKEIFEKIRNEAYNITLSLQVQDITSQQLAAVNHLIESVQQKLAALLTNFNEQNSVSNFDLFDNQEAKNGSFNPEARYTKSDSRQQLADSIITSKSQTTQEEIDKLFITQR